MRPLRKWLLPGLTLLFALLSALLPQQLSRMRDHRQFGRVHADEMTVDSGFPALDTALADRLDLLSRAMEPDSKIVSALQNLMPTGVGREPDQIAQAALARLQDVGALPETLPAPSWIYVAGERVIYQDSTTGKGASFLYLSCQTGADDEGGFWCTIDEQTGAVCGFTYIDPMLEKLAAAPEDACAAFLDSLGLTASAPPLHASDDILLYQTDGSPSVWYQFHFSGTLLSMQWVSPELYGYAVSDSASVAVDDAAARSNDQAAVTVR